MSVIVIFISLVQYDFWRINPSYNYISYKLNRFLMIDLSRAYMLRVAYVLSTLNLCLLEQIKIKIYLIEDVKSRKILSQLANVRQKLPYI